MPTTEYAVLDLETTGLFPGGNDRIIEIGIVLVDSMGRPTDEWSTLINPQRDLGPSHVHGIYGRHAKHAPRFADVSDELLEVLDGRTVVAHNASFDTRFLAAEWKRAGALAEPSFPFGHLCTMQLARTFLPGSGRALVDCCAAFDIEIHDAHSALGDARATAALLAAYREADPLANAWHAEGSRVVDARHLTRLGTRAALHPRDAATDTSDLSPDADAMLERIVVLMPADDAATDADTEYLALLDRCLEDHLLTVTEAETLTALAREHGLSDSRRRDLHERYFESVVATAWADDVLSDDEIREIQQLADILDISDEQRSEARKPRPTGRRARTSPIPHIEPDAASPHADLARRLQPGDHVVLTGTMRRSRDAIKTALQDRGFVVHPAVTKKTKVLVAADPDSLSGKARKAVQYGTPIVTESWLDELLAD